MISPSNVDLEILDELARVGGVVTSRGLYHGLAVVVKRIPSVATAENQLQRSKIEVDALADIDSQNIVGPLALVDGDDTLCLIRPYLERPTLAERLRTGALTLDSALVAGADLLRALALVHARGVQHLAIHPGNIFVDRGVAITDFVAARLRPAESAIDAGDLERVHYMSPEVAGLINREVGEHADLFSVGVVLYECLTGHKPWRGDTLTELLNQLARTRVPRISSQNVPVPAALDDVLARLMAKDPRDRYQSAGGALHDIELIRTSVMKGDPQPDLVVGRHDRRLVLSESEFVGRQTEKASLHDSLEQARHGGGGLVYVEGASGSGKSRLLDEWIQDLSPDVVRVFRGQGVDASAQLPFEVLGGVAGNIVKGSELDHEWALRLRALLGETTAAVVDALPELDAVFGKSETSHDLGPESLGELRSLRSLTMLLDALGSDVTPALVVLDDCQWADDLTLKLLGHWQRANDGQRHTVVVATFRREEVDYGHLLRRIKPSMHLMVEPLGVDEVRSLGESMAGVLPAEAHAIIGELAEGNPFMATAVLRGLVETGALQISNDEWRLDPDASKDVQSSRQAAAFLVQRLSALPDDIFRLLQVAAVIGKKFKLELVARLTGISDAAAIALLTDARRRCIVWTSGSDTNWSFVHDKLREALLQITDDRRRGDIHLEAAEYLQANSPESVFDLAYHFDAAGEAAKALPFALSAGRRARSQHALEAAEIQYLIASRGVNPADSATQCEIQLALGDIFTLRGRYDKADRWYAKARRLSLDTYTRAELESKIGELSFKRGDYESAVNACSAGLEALGRHVPRHSVSFVVRLLGNIVIQTLHVMFPRILTGRRSSDSVRAKRDLLAVRIYDRLAYLWFFAQAGKIPAGFAGIHAMNIADKYESTPDLGYACTIWGSIISVALTPFTRFSTRYLTRSLEVHSAHGNMHGQGQLHAYRWVARMSVFKFDEAIAEASEGRRLLSITGDQWDVNACSWGMAMTRFCMGQLEASASEARELYQAATEIMDTQNVATGLFVLAHSHPEEVPLNVVDSLLDQQNLFLSTRASLLGAKGIYLLHQDQPKLALKCFDEASYFLIRVGLIDILIERILAWRVTAARCVIESAGVSAITGRKVRRWTRAALISGGAFHVSKPHARREAGLIAVAQGNRRRAKRLLDGAVKAATQANMPFEEYLCLDARIKGAERFNWPTTSDREQQGRLRDTMGFGASSAPTTSAVEFPRTTVALIDRFSTVIQRGRQIASSLSSDAIWNALELSANDLFAAEQCVILTTDDNDGLASLGSLPAIERAWLDRSARLDTALSFNADNLSADDEGLLALNYRSALCAPVKVRERVVGFVMATDKTAAGIFGDAEEQLISFITTLAGAALENAEGIAELEDAHRQLEEESQAHKGAILESALDAIVTISDDGRVIESNPAADRLFGSNVATRGGDFLNAAIADRSRDQLRKLFGDRNKPFTGITEVTATRTDGTEFPAEISMAPVRVAQATHMTTIVVRDISERKRVESELNARNEALKETNRELRAAELNARAATQAKSDFLANMSHEIRTPMNAVVGMTALLLDTNLTEEQRGFADIVKSGSEHLLTVISDILDFSKIESGRLELEYGRFSISECVHDAVELVTGEAAAKSLNVTVKLDPAAPDIVVGDRVRLRQILLNLLGNAVKFTPSGEVSVSVDYEGAVDYEDAPQNARPTFTFAVADTGLGMSSETQAKLFEPFSQGDVSTTRLFGGTGLGLAICRRLIELMGGTISVSSVVGEGSVFTFHLQLLPVADVNANVQNTNGEQPRTARQSDEDSTKLDSELAKRFPLRVLVAEDNDVNQKVMAAMLARLGYQPDFAANGREALELVITKPYDLVFMDMLMPEMDGLTATRLIREQADIHQPRIAALTANVASEDAAKCLAAGADTFLSKPLTTERLIETLRDGERADGETPPEDASASDFVDPQILAHLAEMLGVDNAKACLQLFLSSTPKLLAEFTVAEESRDAATARRCVHTLKSSSITLGFKELSALAAELEALEDDELLARSADRTNSLSSQFDKVRDYCRTKLPDWIAVNSDS